MQATKQAWCYSFDNSNFSSGSFAEKEQALIDAQGEGFKRNEGEHGEGLTSIYVAKCELAVNEMFFPDAGEIINHMHIQAEDVGRHYADDYPDVHPDAEAELNEKLRMVLNEWCNTHEIAPTFYTVHDSEMYNLFTLEKMIN